MESWNVQYANSLKYLTYQSKETGLHHWHPKHIKAKDGIIKPSCIDQSSRVKPSIQIRL